MKAVSDCGFQIPYCGRVLNRETGRIGFYHRFILSVLFFYRACLHINGEHAG
jgi:hypothetical protein